jgi:hypothetical protein
MPSTEDRTRIAASVASLMRSVTEPGKVAGGIVPPEIGSTIRRSIYEYVRLN